MRKRFGVHFPSEWENLEFVSFVEAEYVNDDVNCLSGSFAKEITRGRFSVTAKHHLAYHDMVVHEYAVALIVEDDADFKDHFFSNVTNIIKALPENWSNCFLACDPSGCCPDCRRCQPPETVCAPPRGIGSCCAYGYLVSLHGARQIISHMPIRTTPDAQMDYIAKTDQAFKTYMVSDWPIFERALGADMVWLTGDNLNKALP